ncbi:fibronectin type III domain-containing protein [Hippea alviniae]|uniref:fibronectin type III domain-containing protein n=1 Tax=Hippea alviniae TaxID=1279027 RepID=UPI0003B37239|nr:fibronectin type III domain-containing protein [Hippea alviniae]
MKRLFLLMVSVLLLTSCATLNRQPTVITDLPVVKGITAKSGIRSVGLSWQPVMDSRVKGYLIYRAPSETGPFERIAKIDGRLKTNYVDDGGFLKHLEDNTTYFYKIVVYSDKGIGPSSRIVAATTLPPPKSPTQIQATSGLPRMVAIRWQPPKDNTVVAYNIYRSTKKDGPYKKIGRVNGYVNTLYIDKGLKDGKTYYYSVASVNYKGVEGELLAIAKATTKFKPLPPSNLTATIAGAGKLKIFWWPSPTADVVKYRIYRSTTDNYDTFSMVGEVPSKDLSFVDSGLKPGKKYYYYITSVDKDGLESKPSKIYGFMTKPLPLPPTGISVKQVGKSVVLNWDKGSNDTVKYEVFRRHFLIFTQKIAETTNTYYTDNTVSPNTTYYYYVKSVDKYGQESEPSPEVKIEVK